MKRVMFFVCIVFCLVVGLVLLNQKMQNTSKEQKKIHFVKSNLSLSRHIEHVRSSQGEQRKN